MRQLLLSLICAASLGLNGAAVEGRITDGQRGLPGVRVYPARVPRVRIEAPLPLAVTDADGRFRLDLPEEDRVLVVEKEGWRRDFLPRLEPSWVLRPAWAGVRSAVMVVRLDFVDERAGRSDEELRRILFSRKPGEASVANYFYEISKGELELVEGEILHLTDTGHPRPRTDAQRLALVGRVLEALKARDLTSFDRINNATGMPGGDGKPDHLWIIAPGAPGNVTGQDEHLSASSFLNPLPWKPAVQWSVLFMTEETPLGILVHEAMHGMGEHRVDDFYMDPKHPLTAGTWDVMDAGQFRGWDRQHPLEGPWQQDMGYSPAQPMGWTRAELWYRGRFRNTVSTLKMETRAWEGWLDPLERAPGAHPQRLLVPDPRRRGHFWEFSVRRPWGFDGGRVGGRWGAGFEGLLVARIRPERLSVDGGSRGPVQVIDAHPGTPEPPKPRYPWGRWQLDDAAFNLGTGEVGHGQDGPLRWRVLEIDGAGRMRVAVRVR
ncbi:carboxypeptidase-like regulatory domain-containing protein [Holophaga foetida]|uniref:carboxypeptidase-like regulatory domain-containing protein n=1 Tax=Holophaga foetida TaxID=35839 RepID=UPI000247461B|nr:carboxypeptidase-like regulatory domain-containing protein [Holophaga foetida]